MASSKTGFTEYQTFEKVWRRRQDFQPFLVLVFGAAFFTNITHKKVF